MFQFKVSDKISMRSFEEKDSSELYEVVNMHRAYLRQWLPWVDTLQNKEDAVLMILQNAAMAQHQKGLSLMILEEGHLVGGISFYDWDQELQKVQLGYWLIPSAQGKGIIYQSAYFLIGYLFYTLNIYKISIEYLSENIKSASVAKALGFTQEGLLRKHTKHQGSYKDVVIGGLLRDEWQIKSK